MKLRKIWTLSVFLILLLSFSGCTDDYSFSYQEKEILPNDVYKVHTKADNTLEIGYSWMIIDSIDDISVNETIFRVIAPSGKELLMINTTEKNQLYEGSIKCKENGIYELSWENTDMNNTIRIKYDWDWVQENAALYTLICYGIFLVIVIVILVLVIFLYKKNQKVKMLEKKLEELQIKKERNNEDVNMPNADKYQSS